MDHRLAEAQLSVEKYTLNELSSEERTEFEEHMFDCPVCSDLVRQNFTATENLKDLLLEDKQASLGAAGRAVQRSGWRAWFTLPSLVPTTAALAMACFIFSHPSADQMPMTAQVVPPSLVLKTASRGAAQKVRLDHSNPVTLLKFNVDKLSEGAFEGELDNSLDKKLMDVSRSVKTDEPVEIQFPTKALAAGHYKLVLRSAAHPDNSQIYAFEVE